MTKMELTSSSSSRLPSVYRMFIWIRKIVYVMCSPPSTGMRECRSRKEEINVRLSLSTCNES